MGAVEPSGIDELTGRCSSCNVTAILFYVVCAHVLLLSVECIKNLRHRSHTTVHERAKDMAPNSSKGESLSMNNFHQQAFNFVLIFYPSRKTVFKKMS